MDIHLRTFPRGKLAAILQLMDKNEPELHGWLTAKVGVSRH
jgi:hypothetical protein